MPSNPAFEKDTRENVQDAEAVFLDATSNDFENESLGYGDADTHGCWHKFKEYLRSTLILYSINPKHCYFKQIDSY